MVNLLENIRLFLFNPREFIHKQRQNSSIRHGIIILLTLSSVYVVISIMIGLLGQSGILQKIIFIISTIFFEILLYIPMFIAMTFVIVGIYFILIILFKAKCKFEELFYLYTIFLVYSHLIAVIYYALILLLWGIFPFLNLIYLLLVLFFVQAIYLMYIVLLVFKEVSKLSMLKSFFVWLIPIATGLIISLLFFFIIFNALDFNPVTLIIASATQNPELCERYDLDDHTSICYNIFAYFVSDYKTCDKINNGDFRLNCYIHNNQVNNNPKLCDSLNNQNESYDCYLNIALNQENSTICKMVSNDSASEYCYADFISNTNNGSISLACESLKGDKRDDCYWNNAILLNDTKLCNQLNDEIDRLDCYVEIVYQTEDVSYCDDLSGNDEINCHWSSALALNNTKFCDYFEYDYVDKAQCYGAVAIKLNDYSRCKNNLNTNEAQECYWYVGLTLNDTKFCNYIEDSSVSANCYNEIAKNLKNDAICNELESSTDIDQCYYNLALYLKDPVICNKLSNINAIPICKEDIKSK